MKQALRVFNECIFKTRLLFTHPLWVWEWMKGAYQNKFSNKHHMTRFHEYNRFEYPMEKVIEMACSASREQVNHVLAEYNKIPFDKHLDSAIPAEFDASARFTQLCYSMVRLRKPSIVVETGVARGATSYYLLNALEMNGIGRLYSIDLPMLKPESFGDTGVLVPKSLRERWELIIGPSVREMKKLRRKIESIDVFIHDSQHSYVNQLAEYQIAFSWLKKGGILISDDIANDALLEISEKTKSTLMVVKQPKRSFIGLLCK